ncbi:hypothetical protein OS493_009458 [Desmophyllum pertusum]|uniref:Uncharacterized protein n=1 Tax=Desmophyllum pertusum TaxID=174260 RepID=A0A9W9Z338_9CNID|nr:hypothetical protein OS493_009458 [Desmophyllum pertusum]
MNFVTRFIVALILVCCLCELSHAKKGSKHHKHPEKPNSSEVDEQNSANGSVAFGTSNVASTEQPLTTSHRPVKVNLVPQTLSRRHIEKRCCRIGYRAAKRKLFCRIDGYYTAKYTNMEHFARQKFQQRKPSRATRRFMHHLERYCIKHQLKSVFFKCCLDGRYTAREKGGQ